MKERWKQIPGCPDYEVSNLGQVRSWKRTAYEGPRPRIITPKNLNLYGHKYVECYNGGKGQRVKFNLGRLVLSVWEGPPPSDKHVCMHQNDNPSDNKISNLKWGTLAENNRDCAMRGRTARGEKNVKAVLTERDVVIIRRLYETAKLSQREIADCYQVTQSTIRQVLSGGNWAHVQ